MQVPACYPIGVDYKHVKEQSRMRKDADGDEDDVLPMKKKKK